MRRAASWRLLALAGASCVAVAGALAGVPVQTVPAAGGSGVANGQVAVTAGDTGNGLGTDVAQMPYGLAVAANGEIYVSDFSDPAAVEPDPAQPGNATGDSVIRVLDPATDTEQVVAGDGDGASQTVVHGKQSVAATDSSLDDPAGMAIDPTNESLVFDEPWLQVATRYTPPSGTDPGTVSEVCSTDGAGTVAGGDAAVDSYGNVVIPIIGGTGVEVWAAQTGTFWGKAMTAGKTYTIPTPYNDPWAVAIDPHDNLLVSSSGDSLDVLAGSTGTYYDQAMTVGNWYHLAGQPTTNSGDAGFGGDGGPATSALIGAPHGISLDANGNILLADTDNNRIHVIAQSHRDVLRDRHDGGRHLHRRRVGYRAVAGGNLRGGRRRGHLGRAQPADGGRGGPVREPGRRRQRQPPGARGGGVHRDVLRLAHDAERHLHGRRQRLVLLLGRRGLGDVGAAREARGRLLRFGRERADRRLGQRAHPGRGRDHRHLLQHVDDGGRHLHRGGRGGCRRGGPGRRRSGHRSRTERTRQCPQRR